MVEEKLLKDKKFLIENIDIVILAFIVFLAVSSHWIGFWALLILYFVFVGWRISRVVKIMKPFMNDGIIADFGRSWEREQLGYDLDDPYWKDKKRPTVLQKIKGINPNWTEEENAAWREKVLKAKEAEKK